MLHESILLTLAQEVARDFKVYAKHRFYVEGDSYKTLCVLDGWVWQEIKEPSELWNRLVRNYVQDTSVYIKPRIKLLIEKGKRQEADALSQMMAFLEGCLCRDDWRQIVLIQVENELLERNR